MKTIQVKDLDKELEKLYPLINSGKTDTMSNLLGSASKEHTLLVRKINGFAISSILSTEMATVIKSIRVMDNKEEHSIIRVVLVLKAHLALTFIVSYVDGVPSIIRSGCASVYVRSGVMLSKFTARSLLALAKPSVLVNDYKSMYFCNTDDTDDCKALKALLNNAIKVGVLYLDEHTVRKCFTLDSIDLKKTLQLTLADLACNETNNRRGR